MKNGYQDFFKKAQSLKEAPKQPSAEQKLKRTVHAKVSSKMKHQANKREKGMNWMMATCSIVLLAISLGYFFPDELESMISKVEIKAVSSALAAEDKAKAPEKTSTSEEGAGANSAQAEAKDKEAAKAKSVPDVRTWSKEELSIFEKLNDRKKELDSREADLNRMDEELQKQKVELEAKMRQLEKLRGEISAQLQTRIEGDKVKVEKLVQVYSSMKAQQAAKVIETLNEDLAIEVLDQMKKKNAAEILNLMDAKKAKRLSEMMAGYKVVQ